MKKALLFPIIFLLFVATAVSQQYHPFLNNSSWTIYDWVSCCRAPVEKTIHEGTDVVIDDDFTYTKFNDPFDNPSNFIYIREDIAARKVYKIVNGVDALLYDFSLQTGDVILQYGNTFTATVDSIILNDGTTRKRINLVSAESYCSTAHKRQTWIEGVGSDSHPFYPQWNGFIVCSAGGGWRMYTKCSFQNGEQVYGNLDCMDVSPPTLSVNDAEALSSQITFSPNPFNTELTIHSDTILRDATVTLYNLMGQLVLKSTNQSGNNLIVNRNNLECGLYFIQLYEQEKLVSTNKIMVN